MAKGRKKKRSRVGDFISGVLMLAALAVFLYSGYTLYGFYQEYRKGSEEYDNLENDFAVENQSEDYDALEDDEVLEHLEDNLGDKEMVSVVVNDQEMLLPTMYNPIDFDELEQVNEDIVGWLRIRALDISYPVVQGEDNDYYLHKTFEGEDNIAGCLFFNYENSPELTDMNTILYGHNMRNGSMFGKLKKFREEGVFEKSKFFWVFTPALIYQYRIFSAMTVPQIGTAYQTFYTDKDFEEYIETAFENSVIEKPDVTVTPDDKIMTLSTCTGDSSTRFVVLGKLVQMYVSKE